MLGTKSATKEINVAPPPKPMATCRHVKLKPANLAARVTRGQQLRTSNAAEIRQGFGSMGGGIPGARQARTSLRLTQGELQWRPPEFLTHRHGQVPLF